MVHLHRYTICGSTSPNRNKQRCLDGVPCLGLILNVGFFIHSGTFGSSVHYLLLDVLRPVTKIRNTLSGQKYVDTLNDQFSSVVSSTSIANRRTKEVIMKICNMVIGSHVSCFGPGGTFTEVNNYTSLSGSLMDKSGFVGCLNA